MFDSVMIATVTYGARWNYLKQLISRLEEIESVKGLTIFDNGSTYSVQDKIKNVFDVSNLKIKVINSHKNLGSAGGYNRLLAYCMKKENEYKYILLLDDDNLPERNIFRDLEEDVINEHVSMSRNVISFYRERYANRLFTSKRTWMTKKYQNTYCKFSIINKLFPTRDTNVRAQSKFVEVPYAQYSGLFFPTNLLKKVGLPNADYYLYVDDTDFTFRITLLKYKLLVYGGGKIEDLENSWSQIRSDKEIDPHKSIFHSQTTRGLYYIRNRVFFEESYLVTNKALYNLNIIIYYFFILFLFMPKTVNGVLVFRKMIKAVIDGKRGKLGEFYE